MISRVSGSSRPGAADRLGMHQRLEPGPDQLEVVGVGRQDAPEVGDEVDPLGRLDVGEDRRDPAGRLRLLDRAHRRIRPFRHGWLLSSCRSIVSDRVPRPEPRPGAFGVGAHSTAVATTRDSPLPASLL